jgi:hypothetical protein
MRHRKDTTVEFVPSESLKDCPLSRKALDFYLAPTPSAPSADPFIARTDLSMLEALNHASELLRCAAATAYESADALKGPQRDLGLSVVHMINMARSMVDRSLDVHPQQQ